MIPIPERHVTVLRSLQKIWNSGQFIVIGAAAIACHLDFRWRGTIDLDLSVASGLDTYVRELESLGWRRKADAPQRWIVPPDDFFVDVVPSQPSLVSQGGFTWPDGSGHINLVGFRLAFADAASVKVAPAFVVRVASLRSLMALKVAAYLDRPRERDNDLADIVHIMSEYVGPTTDKRWSDEIIDLGMDFEDVSPFVLGKELGALVDSAERRLLQRFLATIEDPEDRLATLHRMARRAPAGWRDPAQLRLRVLALRRGFESQ